MSFEAIPSLALIPYHDHYEQGYHGTCKVESAPAFHCRTPTFRIFKHMTERRHLVFDTCTSCPVGLCFETRPKYLLS
jgi:hypothetical protein